MKAITVLLVDDHMIFRQGIRSILATEPDIRIIGEAQDGRQGVSLATSLTPDVIITDLTMPFLDGIEATRQILQIQTSVKVIVLTGRCDESSIRDALESGAVGYMLKQSSKQELAQAIRIVFKGGNFSSPEVEKRINAIRSCDTKRISCAKRGLSNLTQREIEVLQMIAEGNANKESAAVLGISIKTVEKHREHLMRKLGIHDTASVTRYAISEGYIDCGIRFGISQLPMELAVG